MSVTTANRAVLSTVSSVAAVTTISILSTSVAVTSTFIPGTAVATVTTFVTTVSATVAPGHQVYHLELRHHSAGEELERPPLHLRVVPVQIALQHSRDLAHAEHHVKVVVDVHEEGVVAPEVALGFRHI